MESVAYRLTKARHQETAFTGTGAVRNPGRWHRAGTPIVYTSDSAAGALLEVLVHTDADALLARAFVLFTIRFDPARHLLTLPENALPEDWEAPYWPPSTQELGTRWFEEQDSVILEVPSAIVPHHHNYLINPEHSQFEELDISEAEEFRMVPRLES